MSAAVLCDCMPPALEALGRARGPGTLISSEEFGALVMREFDICGAQTVRDSTRRDCAKFTPPDAPPTYCACFSAAIDGLTDEQIVEDSLASRDNLEQRAVARRDSTPEPPLYEGLLARIDKECQRAQPAHRRGSLKAERGETLSAHDFGEQLVGAQPRGLIVDRRRRR